MTTIHTGKDLYWKEGRLFDKKELILEIVPDEVHKHMFWIKWPDGSKSVDFYNITRAKDHAVKLTLGLANGSTKIFN